MLATHRGFDPGALATARLLARALAAPLVVSTVSRLLVDLNRSIGHAALFSDATRCAPTEVRASIVERHYRPYRDEVERLARQLISRRRRVIHVSSHTFTPVLDGEVRRADVGLLYHPGRRAEAELCESWKASLASLAPWLRVRRNYPYAGKDDGLTSYLRKSLAQAAYVGIELEVNQAIVFAAGPRLGAVRRALVESLREASRRAGAKGGNA